MTEEPAPRYETSASKIRTLIPIFLAGIFMIVGVLVLVWLGRDRDRLTGSTLSDLDLQPLLEVDREWTFEAGKGKVVIYHFWGPWSAECREEWPKWVAFAKRYEGDGEQVAFVSVACAEGSSSKVEALKGEVTEFFAKVGVGYPSYCDPAMYTRTNLVKAMPRGGFLYPTTLLVDTKGRISDVWRGRLDEVMLGRAIDRLRMGLQP